MTTLNIHNAVTIEAKGTHTNTNAKPVICIDTGEVFASVTDAAEHLGAHWTTVSANVRGRAKTCKGKRFCYLSKATENLEALTAQITKLNADAEDARKWREYQAEQERIKAEQERIEKERREREMKLIKLSDKLARRNRMVEKLEVELAQAIAYRDEAKEALDAFNQEVIA